MILTASIAACPIPGVRRYSLSPRRHYRDPAAAVPGPGTYRPSNPAHRPRSIAMGLRLSDDGGGGGRAGPGPGPADYEVDAATTFASGTATKGGRPAAPSWTFGPRSGSAGGTGSGFCCMHGPGELVAAAGGGRRRREPPGPGMYSPRDGNLPSGPRCACVRERRDPLDPPRCVCLCMCVCARVGPRCF
jgi:hypothetical protein